MLGKVAARYHMEDVADEPFTEVHSDHLSLSELVSYSPLCDCGSDPQIEKRNKHFIAVIQFSDTFVSPCTQTLLIFPEGGCLLITGVLKILL